MKEIRLKPISEPVRDVQELERYLLGILKQYFYAPLMSVIGQSGIRNARELSAINKAIESGQIRYTDGAFTGKFTAEISKTLKELGAVWNRGKWEISPSLLNSDLLLSLNRQKERDELIRLRFDSELHSVLSWNEASSLKPRKFFYKTSGSIEEQLKESFKAAAKHITIEPKLSTEAKEKVRTEYTENLKLAVKDFKEKEVLALRKQVEQHVFSGNRYEELSKILKQSFGVAQRKAKFLARQETNLLSAKLAQTRYAEAGVDDYEWRTVTGTEAHPVRPYHRALDRTRQKFSNPPITNAQGNHNNPSEDYNCRCLAIPIVKIS